MFSFDTYSSQMLSKELFYFKNLKCLTFSVNYNNISKDGLDYIKMGFKTLKKLESLIFSFYDYLGHEGAEIVGEMLGDLTNLNYLSLIIGWNAKIGLKGAIGIGKGIKNLIWLKTLQMTIFSSNQIESNGAKALAEGLENLLFI